MQRPILLIYLVQTAASRTRRALGSRKLIGCRICLHAQSVSVVTLGSLIHIQDSHSLTRMTCTRNLMPKRTSSCKSADASTFSFSTSWATIRPSVAPHDLSKQKNNRALPLRRTSFFFVSFIGSSGFIRTIPPVTFKSLSEISPARFRDKSTKLRMSSEREKRSMKLLFGEKEDMEI